MFCFEKILEPYWFLFCHVYHKGCKLSYHIFHFVSFKNYWKIWHFWDGTNLQFMETRFFAMPRVFQCPLCQWKSLNCYVICLTLFQTLTAGARRKLSLLLPHKRFICSNICQGSLIRFVFCITNLWSRQKVLSSFLIQVIIARTDNKFSKFCT